jgi:CRP-like cAMP-binding protein
VTDITQPSDASEIVRDFFARYPEKTFAKGQTVLLPDEKELPPVTYLVKGVIVQYDITPSGDKVVINMFKAGAFFPMSCAMNGIPNPFYFEASEACTARQAGAEDVVAFLREQPEVAYNLLQRVYRGTDGLLGRMAKLLGGDAQARLLYEIHIHAQRFGEQTPEGTTIKITEETLAQQTGLARETVSRELGKLREQGLIKQARGSITV